MILKEASEQLFFAIYKGTDIATGHNDVKIASNQNIWRDDGLGGLNMFLDDHIPGVEICKIFIRENGKIGYLHIKIYIESNKMRRMRMIKCPY